MIYREFKLSELLNLSSEDKKYLRKLRNVVYRFEILDTGMSYVGVTRSVLNRLFNQKFGHISVGYFLDHKNELYTDMKRFSAENTIFHIEKECLDLVDLSDSEIEIIKKYNSYELGYNKTRGGFIRTVLVSNGIETIKSDRNSIPYGYKIVGIPSCNRVDLKGRVMVNDGTHAIRIRSNQVDYYLEMGYFLGGGSLMSSMTGKIYVYKTSKSDRILINRDELDYYKSLGYKKGRCDENNPMKGKVRVNNGVINKLVNPKEIPNGFHRGYLGDHKGNLGRNWINNGVIDRSVKSENLDEYLTSGDWKLGRLSSSKRNKVSIYNSMNERKFVNKSDLNDYLSLGWSLGTPPTLKSKNKNRIFMNNGIKNIMSKPEDVESNILKGYVIGIKRSRR